MLRYNFNNASGLCARQFGGTYGLQRFFYSRTELRNIFAGGIDNNIAGIPAGRTDEACWILPQSAGGIAAYEELRPIMSLSLLVGIPVPASGNVNVAFTVTGTLTGTAALEGAVTPYAELSPKSLADAVWNAESSQYTTPGTMGKNANDVTTNAGLIPAAL